VGVDDRKLGSVLRALRRRRRLRQVDVAVLAGVTQSTVSRVERGHSDMLALATLRRLFGAVDARIDVVPLWRAGELDRLLDEDHAALCGQVANVLERAGWSIVLEATYSRYGERGSIDILAAHPDTRTVLVVEIKTQLISIEEIGRRLDQKTRLAPAIASERFGWRASTVGRLLVLPSLPTERRRVARQGAVVAHLFPVQAARTVRRWLRQPIGPLAGIWFVSFMHGRAGSTVRPRGPRRSSSSSSSTHARRR